MTENSFIQDFMENMKHIQKELLNYLENDEIPLNDYLKLIQIINDKKIFENKQEFKMVLYLISSISNSHFRTKNFLSKVDQLIKSLEPEIKKQFTNLTIFSIFKKNKRLIYFLLKEQIITIDTYLAKMLEDSYFVNRKYKEYLLFNTDDTKKQIGENEKALCEIIRNDSIVDFIIHINKTNIDISKTNIQASIYETNPFLSNQNKEISLIEYAAFYGSIQIFNYLRSNHIELTPSIWLYAIHGNSPEMIQILEENKISPKEPKYFYFRLFKQASRCHHNNIANYILETYFNNVTEDDLIQIYHYNHRYYNFIGISDYSIYLKNVKNINFDLCKYDYFVFADFLSKSGKFMIKDNYLYSDKIMKKLVLDGNNDMINIILDNDDRKAHIRIISSFFFFFK